MSLRGRVSKVKRHLHDAKSQLLSLEKGKFTEDGIKKLDFLKRSVTGCLQICDELRDEITSEQKPDIETDSK